ncbi:MAG: ATPase [Gammaproteobacteria bacterium RIFCSPHIGHO2_12_FULL_41_20]|nr:MAG: ATPase [Gammaproteobacteria bacterium RIFCSPHIGHO2_12_FULL_41_20]
MKDRLIQLIYQANPWLKSQQIPIQHYDYIPRLQTEKLLSPEWDNLWLVLVGPRQAGKTTLAKHLAQVLIQQRRFETLLYLNCDLLEVRQWLTSPLFIQEAMDTFHLEKPIILIDEVQRLENPGLLLKACADLKLNIKMIATGSSQLELKSKVQEYLTGRHLQALILPLSYQEIGDAHDSQLVFGCYPAVVKSSEKTILLQQIYQDYIAKDIIEILKIGKPDVMQKLIALVAHSSGQLVNYNQLATDCLVSVATIRNYLSILESTYTILSVTPFVGNKRKEITSNPILYFIDNGFRNQSLHNLSMELDTRQDVGLLVQSAVFQELYKFKVQHFCDFIIHFWRTQSSAEVDFVLYKNTDCIIPIEVKFKSFNSPVITRSFRSFIDAYQPRYGFFITKDFNKKILVNNCEVNFISISRIANLFFLLKNDLKC